MSDAPGSAPPVSMLTKPLLALLAAAAGVSVAANYYNQAMLGIISADFDTANVGLVPVATQLGNALGLALLAPLGDKFERRRLIAVMMSMLGCALLSSSMAPSFSSLVAGCFVVGACATVTQHIVPVSVHLAAPASRARALGVVTGVIFSGILLARTYGGIATDFFGWRWAFAIAGAATGGVAFLLWRGLPELPAVTRLSYGRLLMSLASLVARHRTLRVSAWAHGLVFAGFGGFWATIALMLREEPFRLGPSAVGLIALLGAFGVLLAPLAGRLTDRHGSRLVAGSAAALASLSFMWMLATPGWLWGLLVGTLALDLAVLASQVSNQARILSLDPDARSRLNTVFMAGTLFCGTAGAAIAGLAFAIGGWQAVCGAGALAALVAAILVAVAPE